MVLAGGAGQRLRPLTLARCKPAVPFGGTLRLIDFTLINCLESGVRRVFVLAQRQQATLREHVAQRWSELARAGGAEVVFTCGQDGYTGNADAVLQNLPALEALRPDAVLVLSADHVYRADYARLVELHLARGADATILTGTAAASEASRFGVLSSSPAGWITSFVEKPLAPEALVAGRICDINLGVYCFRLPFLRQLLLAAAARGAARDFGKDILPAALAAGRVLACPLSLASPDDCPYWRDVGTVASYFEASMDLVKDPPAFGLEHSALAAFLALAALAPVPGPEHGAQGGRAGGRLEPHCRRSAHRDPRPGELHRRARRARGAGSADRAVHPLPRGEGGGGRPAPERHRRGGNARDESPRAGGTRAGGRP